MPNDFSNIGFRVNTPDEFQQLATVASKQSTSVPTHVGGAYLHFTVPEGPELWVQMSPDQELIGCHPHFLGKSLSYPNPGFQIQIDRILSSCGTPLDGRVVGKILAEEAAACPIVLDIPDYWQFAARLTIHAAAKFQITAFTREIRISENEAAFHADQRRLTGDAGLAPEALIPSGMFKPSGAAIEPPESNAVLTGRVLSAELRINSYSRLPFHALTIKTLGGIIDVVADPKFISVPPAAGGILFGSFSLSARLMHPLPKPPAT